jgi:hypothetical protein
MKFPGWAPANLGTVVKAYADQAEKGEADAPQCKLLAEIWQRLLTRPEMENIWPWILQTTAAFELYNRMGFFHELSYSIERFYRLPRLSETAYTLEMQGISDMAADLCTRLRKFEAPVPGGRPFEFVHMPTSKRTSLSKLLSENNHLDMLPLMLGQFKTITELLENLAKEAKTEARQQAYRLPVSRKSRDLKPFFLREMISYFQSFSNGYSPSKIATICGVALDDPSIDGGLVGKYAKQTTAMRHLD